MITFIQLTDDIIFSGHKITLHLLTVDL
jgi:hypothetical protein